MAEPYMGKRVQAVKVTTVGLWVLTKKIMNIYILQSDY